MLGEFTLLRPLWLLVLPLVIWFIWQRGHRTTAQWQPYITPELLRPLVRTQSNRLGQWLNRLSNFGLLLLPLALAGPALERPSDEALAERPLVFVLDQSLSMLSEDIAPDRHTRARQKIQDWLRAHPERPAGLVAYSGTAHLVSPLTFDHSALNELLGQLSPVIMPMPGSDPVGGLGLALDQLNDSSGDILWLTDDLQPDQRVNLPELAHGGQQLGILTLGSPEGAPIRLGGDEYLRDRSGALVVPGVDTQEFAILANQDRVRWTELSIGDADWQRVLTPQSAATSAAPGDDLTVTTDLGFGLLILALPGLLMWFRRGQLVGFLMLGVGVTLISAGLPQPAVAQTAGQLSPQSQTTWADWFRSPDQQGRARLPEDPGTAFSLFRTPTWQAYAALEAGYYEAAAELMADVEHPRDLYHRGNAMVHLERYEAAVADYEAALAVNPDFSEAEHNLGLVEEFLQQPPPEEEPEDNADPSGGMSGDGESPQSDAPSQISEDDEAPGAGADLDDGGAQVLEESIRRRLPEADATFLQRKFQYQYEADPDSYDSTGPLW